MGNRIVQLSENEYDRLQKKADLNDEDVCQTSVICKHFNHLLHGSEGYGVFKKLKEEK